MARSRWSRAPALRSSARRARRRLRFWIERQSRRALRLLYEICGLIRLVRMSAAYLTLRSATKDEVYPFLKGVVWLAAGSGLAALLWRLALP